MLKIQKQIRLFNYLIKGIIYLFSIVNFTLVFANSPQEGSLSGFVYDSGTGEALIGCNVYLQELGIGSITNLNGYYVITQIQENRYTLICNYIGYKTYIKQISIKAGDHKSLTINLMPDVLEGEIIQVVADSIDQLDHLAIKSISKIDLTQRHISKLPQLVENDLIRSIQSLPGITSVSDFSSKAYIRGGTPDQNLYLLDGADVYNPEHAFGLFSIFNTDAIKKVEVYKGGFGAENGGRLSSIINVTNLDGNREKFEGTLSLSLISAKTTLQVPLKNFGSFSGSFRRTHFDKTVAQFIDDIPDYYFYDMNLKSFFKLNQTNNLTISYFGGSDFLNYIFNENATEKVGLKTNWGNHTGSIRWTTILSPRLFANFWITGSRFDSDIDLDQLIGFKDENEITDLTFKGNLEYSYSQKLNARFGFEQKNIDVAYRQVLPTAFTDIHHQPQLYAEYIETEIKPLSSWQINSGLRYNFFHSDKKFSNFSPRFSSKYRLTENITLKAATGIYHQYLNRIPRAFITDIWSVANKYQRESTAYHYILGYMQNFSRSIELEVEAYHKDYKNIHYFNQAFLAEISTDIFEQGKPVYTKTSQLFHEGDGNSTGFEILLRKNSGIFNGWLGYSYSRTKYKFDTVNQGKYFYPQHDKTSTFNMILNWDVRNLYRYIFREKTRTDKNKLTFGLYFVYASGQPITKPTSAYLINSLPEYHGVRNIFTGEIDDYALYPSEINTFRLPAYMRLDVSLRYQFEFKKRKVTSYIQIFNVGNRKNIWFIHYTDDSDDFFVRQNIQKYYMLPILPSIGIQIDF